MIKTAKLAALLALTVVLLYAALLLRDTRRALAHERVRVDALVSELTLTTKVARQTSAHEAAYLELINGQVSDTLRNLNVLLDTTSATIGAVRPVLEQTQHTLAGMEPVEDAARQTITDVQPALHALTKLETDPNIPLTVAAVRKTAENGAALTGHADHVVAYVDHKVTAPKRWFQKLGGWAEEGASILVKALL